MQSSDRVPRGSGSSKPRPSSAARMRPRMCRVRSNFARRATFAYTTARPAPAPRRGRAAARRGRPTGGSPPGGRARPRRHTIGAGKRARARGRESRPSRAQPSANPLLVGRRAETRPPEHLVQERDRARRPAEVERERRRPKAEQRAHLGGERRPVEPFGFEHAHGPEPLEPSGPDPLLVLAQPASRYDQRGYARPHDVERRVVAALADRRRGAAELLTEVWDRPPQLESRHLAPRPPERPP